MLYIAYSNRKWERICTERDAAMRALPTLGHVQSLFKRLTQLAAFDCVADIPFTPPFRRHKLEGKRKDEWGVDLINRTDGWRICFTAVNQDGSLTCEPDLKKITCIQITSIEDYHRG